MQVLRLQKSGECYRNMCRAEGFFALCSLKISAKHALCIVYVGATIFQYKNDSLWT